MFYNTFLEKALLPIGDKLSGNSFYKQFRFWKNLQFEDPETIRKIQKENLSAILSFASSSSPFYCKEVKEAGAGNAPKLSDFPILTKEIISRNYRDILTVPEKGLTKILTSGSSGTQGFTYLNKNELSANRAIQAFWWEWAGYQLGIPTLQFGVSRQRNFFKEMKDLVLRVQYEPAFGNSNSYFDSIISKMISRRTQFVGGYASSLFLLARRMNESDKKYQGLKGMISWGEKLYDGFKEEIDEAFGIRVRDTYGASEGLSIACECEEGSMHIMDPHGFVEVVDKDGNQVENGKIGHLLVTRLDNYSFPLIRYDIGDMGALQEPGIGCDCGRPFTLLKTLIGRDTDLIIRGENFLTVQVVVFILKHEDEIKEYQLIQETENELVLHYVSEEVLKDESKRRIIKSFEKELGGGLSVIFKKTENLEKTSGGKLQIMLSKFNKAQKAF